jgi:hypothetical protein
MGCTKTFALVLYDTKLFYLYGTVATVSTVPTPLVLYCRDRPKGSFGTVDLNRCLVRLCGQRTLLTYT